MIVIPKEIAELNRKLEQIKSISNEQKAVIDYNIMMGLLDDPSEEEDE